MTSIGHAGATSRRLPRGAKVILWVLVGGGFLLLGLRLLSPIVDYPSAAAGLDEAVSKARALGLPLTAEEFWPASHLTMRENAAPLLRRAMNHVEALPSSKYPKVDIKNALAEGNLKLANSILLEAKPALDLARAASTLPACDFGRNWDLGPFLLFPELAGEKNLVSLLSLNAQVEARQGNHSGALADLRAAQKIAEFSGSEQCLISLLVRIANEAILLAGVEQCLSRCTKPEEVQAYINFLESGRTRLDILRSLRLEVYSGVTALRNLEQFGGERALLAATSDYPDSVDPGKLKKDGLPQGLKARAYLARHLELWTSFFASVAENEDPRMLSARLDGIVEDLEQKKGLSYRFDQIALPVFSQAGVATVAADARWETHRALAKVLLYRSTHGSFPKTLAQAGYERWDPMTRKPLRYAALGNRVRVYSVGRDMRDNHGLSRSELPPDSRNSGYDDVAMFPAPKLESTPSASSASQPQPPKVRPNVKQVVRRLRGQGSNK